MPTSKKQIAANRKNAKKSTGPKSKRGKKAVSTNAVKHGMTATTPLLPNEDSTAFEKMMNALWQELSPSGEVEKALVRRIGVQLWRLQRTSSFETGVIQNQLLKLQAERKIEETSKYKIDPFEDFGKSLNGIIKDEQAHDQLIADYDKLLEQSFEGWAGIGHVLLLLAEMDALGKLSRYETTLERSLIRMMKAFAEIRKQRLNASSQIDAPGTK